jgi:hypothetical protein
MSAVGLVFVIGFLVLYPRDQPARVVDSSR